jgi:aminopeptidase N
MKLIFAYLISLLYPFALAAQQQVFEQPSPLKTYRGSESKTNDLIHTKLEVNFDFVNSLLYGKAWITLQAHFYATDSLVLDAKGIDIHEVGIVKDNAKIALQYRYDSLQLFIRLDKMYERTTPYTIFINYLAKPNHTQITGNETNKGLYFINPLGTGKQKPVQAWTQGATESNSTWMPTIDKPNQKTTQEISMTVPHQYATLSNGILINQQSNADGTRTDHWKMDKPHAPYLFFMGVGEFAVVKEKYKDIEVSYYLEKAYEPLAKQIFGNTTEMMAFFSEKLGMAYPWPKYAQIVVRDFVSGAMENTSATVHSEDALQNGRQLADGNAWEQTIAHELFHQWFGDLVTPESWSNISLSESLANYAEYLWFEKKRGKDAADEHHQNDLSLYLQPGNETKALVRYQYAWRDEVFDPVTYNKGGRILHMLRNYVGDDAFFKSLNLYLITHQFKTAEAGQLRLAFEDITGVDLQWFWNQWFFGTGHPKLSINYQYDDVLGKVKVIITQNPSQVFKLPLAIDLYDGTQKKRNLVWAENQADTFVFAYRKRPVLINVDADKVLLCEKKDNKTDSNYIYQFKFATCYLDRKEAIDFFADKQMKELVWGLSDSYAGIRRLTIEKLQKNKQLSRDPAILEEVEKIAQTDKDNRTKAAALKLLGATGYKKYLPLYDRNVYDSSYTVAAAALEGISLLAPEKAYNIAKKLSTDTRDALTIAVYNVLVNKMKTDDFDIVVQKYQEFPLSSDKLQASEKFVSYLEKIPDVGKVKKGIDVVLSYRSSIPKAYQTYTESAFAHWMKQLAIAKKGEVADYIGAVFK